MVGRHGPLIAVPQSEHGAVFAPTIRCTHLTVVIASVSTVHAKDPLTSSQSEMSAPHQVFKLPETLAAILSNLPGKQDLFASLQVNSLWAEEATTILWADTPPISALVAVHERSDRLNFYAGKVKSLDFAHDDSSYHRLFVNTSFPRLADISIDSSDDNREDVLLQYLQPRLRRFDFYGGPISDAFLMQIQVSRGQKNMWSWKLLTYGTGTLSQYQFSSDRLPSGKNYH